MEGKKSEYNITCRGNRSRFKTESEEYYWNTTGTRIILLQEHILNILFSFFRVTTQKG